MSALTYDLDLQSPASIVMTYAQQKFEVNGQSVPKIEWKQMDGRAGDWGNGSDAFGYHSHISSSKFATNSEYTLCLKKHP